MKILLKVIGGKNTTLLYKLRNYLLVKNNKYSQLNDKITIYKKIANMIEKHIDRIYKRETITVRNNLNLEEIIKNNPQISMIDRFTFQIPTRNLLYLNINSGIRKNRELVNILDKIEYLYQKMINRICLLGYSLNINTPIELMALYYTLCRYSFLSYDILDKEDCNLQIEVYTKDKLGYNILLGHGVCRHHAVFFRDLCLRYGFNARTIFCCAMRGDEQECYGHSFNEIEYNGMILYLDPYNGLSFDFDENNHLAFSKNDDLYFIKDKMPFRYKASLLGFYQMSTTNRPTIKFEDFKNIFVNTIEDLESDEIYPALKEFAVENFNICEKVYRLVNKLKYEILIEQQKKIKRKKAFK